VRLVDRVDEGVQALAERTGRDRSSVVNELLDEGLKMRRIPGIVFGDSRHGRVARVAGTGLGVHEVVRTFRTVGSDWTRLREAYHWLSEQQLRSALAYAEAYPQDIEARLRADEEWTPEQLWQTYPFMRPPRG
jgi:uncharacterized protein (DUF433 family)